MKKLKLYLLLSLLTLSIGQMRAEDAPLTTIQAIFDEARKIGSSTAQAVTITFDNWVVSGVSSSCAYVTDGTKGFFFMIDKHGFTVGDKLTGTVAVLLKLSQGSAAITTVSGGTKDIPRTKGGVITPVEVSIDSLSGVHTGAPIIVKNVTYNGSGLVDASSDTITPVNSLYSGMSFTYGKTYDVKGIYLQYGKNKKIMPRSADDIEELHVYTVKWCLGAGADESLGELEKKGASDSYAKYFEKDILQAGTYDVKLYKDGAATPIATTTLPISTANKKYLLEFDYHAGTGEFTAKATDKGTTTSVDNTELSNKAVKFIQNGQLIIRKNGVEYNAQGARIY